MKLPLFFTAFMFTATVFAASTYIEGYEPNPRYPEKGVRKIYLLIENGKIAKKETKSFEESLTRETKKILESQIGRVILSPGFIDMHSHLDYNVLPLWKGAKGQFGSRFQWRPNQDYRNNVMIPLNNPVLGDPRTDKNSLYCQTYQYAEIKALAGGVTSVQGIGGNANCIEPKTMARNIEVRGDFDVETDARISMEIVNPDVATFYQDKVLPTVISERKTIREVEQSFAEGSIAKKMTDYFAAVAKNIGTLAKVLPEGNVRAFIVHLAEGRSTDSYNKIEYKLVKNLGLAEKGLVIIHGTGLDDKDLADAAAKNISLVWSPFSNLLLYGKSLDVTKAVSYGINIAMGADWSPSGTKNLLDEVKVARKYLQTNGMTSISDKNLYEMMTINAAKALKLEDRLGKLEVGYLADIVAIRLKTRRANPYTQIVLAAQSDIQYVMVGGDLKIAQKSLVTNETNVESLVSAADVATNAACGVYAQQMVMGTQLKLSELTANMKSVFPKLDTITSCNDAFYKETIQNLFTTEWQQQVPTHVEGKNFDKLAEQLEQLN